MSTSVDERIVEMQFNNQQFEAGVKESLGTLDKLKKGLNLDASAKSLSNLQTAGNNFSLNGIASGVDTIASKFSAFGIMGVTMLANIANAAINTGTQLIKSLTIDPVAEGYADYGRKLTSIQTITNATGKSEAVVEEYFGTLDEYADKTIYNLDDMTSAFAKFTNAGVDMDKSVPAIKGIANMVAVAGQDAGAAQIAMYNLSQSIAGGFLTTMDYKSLNLANVATKEWKQNMIDGAIAAGTLKETTDGMYIDTAGKMKEAANMQRLFSEELSSGWATTDVMLKVLGDYGDTTTDIGKKAQAAAQDVKSWSMMMETLKAAVGTGWTDSFQYIIGNLDESKKLFTALTNTIGGFLDKSADARNGMLQFWHDNGGRDKLIQGIKDAFAELSRVIKPLKGAFDAVFPPMTGETLLKISNAVADFLSNVKMGDGDLTNLTKTASGFFSALKLGVKFLGLVGKGFGFVIQKLGPMISGLLEITAGWADFWINLNKTTDSTDAFNKSFEKVKEVINTVSDSISNFLGKIKEKGSNITSGLETFGGRIRATIDSFKEIDLTGLDYFIDGVRARFKPLDKIISFAEKGLAGLRSFMEKLAPFFKSVGDFIKEAAGNVDISTLLAIFQSGAMAGVGISIAKFVTSLKSVTDNAGGFLESIKGILNGVKDCLTAYQKDIQAGTLIKIAIAVGILALSLLLLSTIDPARLATALVGMTALFGELFGSMSIFTKSVDSKGFKSMVKLTVGLMGISIAMLLLAKALTTVATLNWEELAVGLSGLGGILATLWGATKLLSKYSKDMVKASIGLILFGFAIRILAGAVIDLSNISWEGLAKGLLGVIGICGILLGMLKFANFDTSTLQMGAGLVLLAVAIRLIVNSVAALGSMDPGQLWTGFSALGSIMVAIITFTRTVGDGKNLITTGIAMMFIASSMLIFAGAIAILGSMPLEQLGKGLLGMGLALAAVVVAMNFMPPNMLATGVAFLAISIGLIAMAAAIKMLGTMSIEQIIQGVLGLGAALLIIVIAVNAMTGAIVGAAALLVVSAALLGLAFAMKLLGSMSIEQLGIALLGLVAVLVIFGVAAAVLTPIIPAMLALGAAMILLGVGMAAIGAAAIVMAIGMTMMSTVGLVGIGIMIAITLALIPLVALSPALFILGAGMIALSIGILALGLSFTVLGGGLATIVAVGPEGLATLIAFTAMAASLAAFSGQLMLAGIGLTLFGAGAILAGAGALVGGIGLIVLAFALKQLADVDLTKIEGIKDLGGDLLKASLKLLLAAPGLTTGGAALLAFGIGADEAGSGLASIKDNITETVATLKVVPDSVKNAGNAVINAVKALMDGVNAAIISKAPKAASSTKLVCSTASAAIVSQRYLFVNAGASMVEGFVEGIKSHTDSAVYAATSMASRVLRATKAELAIHSPSKAFKDVGMYSVMGFANGLVDYANLAVTASKNLAKTTIAPVMDMSISGNYANAGARFATQSASTSAISDNLQNGGLMQRTLNSLSDLANRDSENSPVDVSGTLTIQVTNDKGEIIGIAQKAMKDLLRKESR